MHYKNGREAKVGDTVIGTTYNRKGIQVGSLVGITPGATSCNARVAIIDIKDLSMVYSGAVVVFHKEGNGTKDLLITPVIDYTACDQLLHAEDVFGAFTVPKA
jgi:hypothetical protein